MHRDDYVAGMRRQVGWFVLLGIGAVILLLLMITVRTDIFAKKFTLYVLPPTATSFFLGQEVKFQGFAIGHVRNIELQPHGQVRVSLRLLDHYRTMLHEGVSARLIKEGLIGEGIIEISGGKKDAPSIRDQGIIAYETEASFEQLLHDLKPAVANADTLLRELVALSRWLNDPDGDVRQAMASFRQASAGMQEGAIGKAVEATMAAASQVRELTHQMVENKMADHLSASLEQTARILKDIEPLAHDLGKQGPETIKRVNVLIGRLDKMAIALGNIAADMEELTPQLPGLAQESRRTLEEMRVLIKSMRGSWLLGAAPNSPEQGDEEIAPPGLDMRP
jgi:phospholipid/cholesterol/gamma-HCH transport system substrate-binding protein